MTRAGYPVTHVTHDDTRTATTACVNMCHMCPLKAQAGETFMAARGEPVPLRRKTDAHTTTSGGIPDARSRVIGGKSKMTGERGMTVPGDNRLSVLAEEIRAAHAGVQTAAQQAAEYAIAAGKALIEAKALVKHGEWLPWLKANCGFAERTAQLYMRIAEKGLPTDVIAALGLKAVATSAIFLGTIDYWSDVPEEPQRLWSLYILFGCHPDHVDWLHRHGYLTPDEWLGPEGTDHRRMIARTGLRQPEPSDDHKSRWAAFKDRHKDKSKAEIDAAIAAEVAAGKFDWWDEPPSKPQRRRRRKSATVADFPSEAARLERLAEELRRAGWTVQPPD